LAGGKKAPWVKKKAPTAAILLLTRFFIAVSEFIHYAVLYAKLSI
jgi:hypothetical protein